ncbi:uncharacterized protein [Antedon mediterranea]|uniref:uncharacterized protein n=1 Tax=Antedon mediterranea TaxID=105859 RepID=UPI003AF74B50
MLYYSSSEDDEVGLIVRGNGSIQSINNGCSAVDDTEGSPTGISTTEVPPAAKRKAWEVSTTDVDTSDDDIPTESADSVCLVTTTKVPPAAERKAWEVSTTDVDTSDVDTSDDDISAACKRNTGGLETVETNYLNSSGSSDDEIKISNHTSKRSEKRKRNHLQPIHNLYLTCCCALMCIGMLNFREIKQTREAFQAMTEYEQRCWILKYFNEHLSTSGGATKICLLVGANKVCAKAWMLVNGIGRSTFYKIRKQAIEGCCYLLPPNFTRKMVYSNSTQQCRAWFIKFCNEYGDQMPTNGQIHLPSTLTKHDVYMHMKDEFELRNEDVCALATFYKFWCVEFKHIVIPEVCLRFYTYYGLYQWTKSMSSSLTEVFFNVFL